VSYPYRYVIQSIDVASSFTYLRHNTSLHRRRMPMHHYGTSPRSRIDTQPQQRRHRTRIAIVSSRLVCKLALFCVVQLGRQGCKTRGYHHRNKYNSRQKFVHEGSSNSASRANLNSSFSYRHNLLAATAAIPSQSTLVTSLCGTSINALVILPLTREKATRQQGGLFFRENSSNGGKAIRTFWLHTKFG
jgi:hypothetical protein